MTVSFCPYYISKISPITLSCVSPFLFLSPNLDVIILCVTHTLRLWTEALANVLCDVCLISPLSPWNQHGKGG